MSRDQTLGTATGKRLPSAYTGDVSMTMNEYQGAALRTASDEAGIPYCALGLNGEAGEVADLVKKHMGQGHGLDVDKIVVELGDVLWYVAVMADRIGYSLGDIAAINEHKLRDRYPDGFSAARSRERAVTSETLSEL